MGYISYGIRVLVAERPAQQHRAGLRKLNVNYLSVHLRTKMISPRSTYTDGHVIHISGKD